MDPQNAATFATSKSVILFINGFNIIINIKTYRIILRLVILIIKILIILFFHCPFFVAALYSGKRVW